MLIPVRRAIFSSFLCLAAVPFMAARANAAPRFLALGDSYTIGTAVDEKKRWVNELVRLMRQDNVEISDPEIIAHNGWTTGDLLAAVDREKPKGPYDLITLMIGVNNQFQGQPIENYRKDLVTLFAVAAKLAGGDPRKIVVISIPDYSATPFAQDKDPEKITAEIGKFNGVLLEETRRARARIVDVTSVSRFVKTNPQLVAEDGLHPSWRLHGVWARLVYPVARPLIAKLH